MKCIVEVLIRLDQGLGMQVPLKVILKFFHRLKDEIHVKTCGQFVHHNLTCVPVTHA